MSKIYLAEKSQLDSIGGSFCICSTAAATVAKTASLGNFTLKTGAQVAVKFDYTNTASSPTLNINGTGAKSICYHNSAVPVSMLMSGGVYLFVYDGSRWQLLGNHFGGGDGSNFGALQFFNILKSSYYSGERLTFSGTTEFSFSSEYAFITNSVNNNNNKATSYYGRINMGDYVKQGYKKLFILISNAYSYDKGKVTFYFAASASTSSPVVSSSFTFEGNTTFSSSKYQYCIIDISNLNGSYYFIVEAEHLTTDGSYFRIEASNVFLLT